MTKNSPKIENLTFQHKMNKSEREPPNVLVPVYQFRSIPTCGFEEVENIKQNIDQK